MEYLLVCVLVDFVFGYALGWFSYLIFSFIPKRKDRELKIHEWLLACMTGPAISAVLSKYLYQRPEHTDGEFYAFFFLTIFVLIPIAIIEIIVASKYCFRYNKTKL